MKRAILDTIVASLLSMLAYFLSAVILAAIANSSEMNKNLFISIACTAAYSLILLYVAKIRLQNGEDELYEDYSGSEYTTIRNDIRYVFTRERIHLTVICAIILLCYLSNVVYMGIFGNLTVFPLTLAFFPMIAFQTLLSFTISPILNLIAHIISAALICLGYLLAVLLYRRNLWKNRNK